MKPHTLRSKEEFRQLMVSLNDGPLEGTRLELKGILQNALRGIFACEVVLDNWPNYTALVLKPTPETKEILRNWIVVFANDVRKLEELLHFPAVVPWKETFYIAALPVQFMGMVERVSAANGSQTEIEHNEPYLVMKFPMETVDLPKLPEGYHAASLKPEDAEFVNQKWEFGGTAQSERLIRFQIANLPTLGIYDKTKQLVSFALGQYDNTTGMGFTLPEHRGLGLGAIANGIVKNNMIKMNKTATFGFVRTSNDIMIKLIRKLNVQQLPDHVFFVDCKSTIKQSKV